MVNEVRVLHVLGQPLKEAEGLIKDDGHRDLRQLLKVAREETDGERWTVREGEKNQRERKEKGRREGEKEREREIV